jgi:hypothetical protein
MGTFPCVILFAQALDAINIAITTAIIFCEFVEF